MEETGEDMNKWKGIPCSWNGRMSTVKRSIIPKAIYEFMQSLLSFQWHFFTRGKQNPKTYRELWKTLNRQSNPEKGEVTGITLPDLRLY